MSRLRKENNKKERIRETAKRKISLYNLRGEKIGELLPGGKIDFQNLIRSKQTKTYKKRG